MQTVCSCTGRHVPGEVGWGGGGCYGGINAGDRWRLICNGPMAAWQHGSPRGALPV